MSGAPLLHARTQIPDLHDLLSKMVGVRTPQSGHKNTAQYTETFGANHHVLSNGHMFYESGWWVRCDGDLW